mgnify:CR=1 FL=1
MSKFLKVFYDLGISIFGGVISGLIVTWIFKSELKTLLSKESLRRIISKEIILIGTLLIFFVGYLVLVKKGVIPPYEFRDEMIVYDLNGNEYVIDDLHPDRPPRPTGVKRDFKREKELLGEGFLSGERKIE